MVQKLKKLTAVFAALCAVAIPALVPVTVMAQAGNDNISNGVCRGVEFSTGTESCTATTAGSDGRIQNLIRQIINIFSIVVGVVAVIMIIIGGLKYITSAGDSGNISSAKNTILYAIVGLVIVALAQFIVRFVLGRALQAGAPA